MSELAQVFFSEQIGTFAGIGVTDALVFAIAPLQHFGQRLSDKEACGAGMLGMSNRYESA